MKQQIKALLKLGQMLQRRQAVMAYSKEIIKPKAKILLGKIKKWLHVAIIDMQKGGTEINFNLYLKWFHNEMT